jgi:hypothetical protein
MTDDLVQRLFAEADNFKVDREVGVRGMLYRAADCIEAQAAEIERLREALNWYVMDDEKYIRAAREQSK